MIGEIFVSAVIVFVCLWLAKEQLNIILYNMRLRRRFSRRNGR